MQRAVPIARFDIKIRIKGSVMNQKMYNGENKVSGVSGYVRRIAGMEGFFDIKH